MTEFERIRAIETRRWAEYAATYAECVRIAEAQWADRLAVASQQQQALAEAMRDRVASAALEPEPEVVYPTIDAQIPVPLFTPRDRLQFLKEATANLFIGTERRNLSVSVPEPETAPVLPFGKSKGTPLADLSDRTLIEARDWAVDHAAAKYPDFIRHAGEELERRTARATGQPLTDPPLALAASGTDEDFA